MGIRDDLLRTVERVEFPREPLGPDLEALAAKLQYLELARRYASLLKQLRECNDRSNFAALVFETCFAHAFEVQGFPLLYEVSPLGILPNGQGSSSIDFRLILSAEITFNFEARILQQPDRVRQSIEDQIQQTNFYSVSYGTPEDLGEIFRLQSTILSKCQDKDGKPIKFLRVCPGEYNFIVIDVSDLMLRSIDTYDCELAAYGDPAVPRGARLGVSGIFQISNGRSEHDFLSQRFMHLRDTVHGVLFIRKAPNGNLFNYDLESFTVPNPGLPLPEEASTQFLSIIQRTTSRWATGA